MPYYSIVIQYDNRYCEGERLKNIHIVVAQGRGRRSERRYWAQQDTERYKADKFYLFYHFVSFDHV